MKLFARLFLKGLALLVVLVVVLAGGFRAASVLRETDMAQDVAPKTGSYVKAGDVNIFIQEKGPTDGSAVVFIGGTMAWSEAWRETLDPVAAAGFRAVAIDLPPFGFSERPETNGYGPVNQSARIIGVLDALGIQRATLVGHSFGGGATVEAALRNSDRVASLVLVDVALGLNAHESEPGFVDWLLNWRFLRNAAVSLTFTNPPVVDYGVKINFYDKAKAQEKHVEVFKSALGVSGTTSAVGDWWVHDLMATPKNAVYRDKARFAQFQAPVLVIWGRDDTITPLLQGEEIAKIFPNSEMTIFDKNGHVPHLEATTAFNDRLIRFLRDHAAP
jgi:pimeloyl-ACP methyl ester carboxylesterase